MPVALITGCSSGFGEAMALAFAERGFDVIATMRNPASAPAALRAQADSGRVVLAELDVTDANARTAVVDLTLERFGRIEVAADRRT